MAQQRVHSRSERMIVIQGVLGAAILVIAAALLVTSAVAFAAPGIINVLGHDIDRDRVTTS